MGEGEFPKKARDFVVGWLERPDPCRVSATMGFLVKARPFVLSEAQ